MKSFIIAVTLIITTPLVWSQNIKNNDYKLTVTSGHEITVQAEGLPIQTLAPEFTVMYSDRDPGLSMNWAGRFDRPLAWPLPALPRLAKRWMFYSNDPAAPARELDALGVKSEIETAVNSAGERILTYRNKQGNVIEMKEGDTLKGTADPYLAGQKTVLRATASTVDGNTIRWRFAEQPHFALTAEIVLPESAGDPQIRYRLSVRKPGYYSVAYTGAPWTNFSEMKSVPQETMNPGRDGWSYLMSEAFVTLPRVHIATAKLNTVLVVDPKESPFRLVEDSKGVWTYAFGPESNSRFGLMAEKTGDRIRPVVFSPIMGGFESRIEAGSTYDFTIRYVARGGDWKDTYKYIARVIYRFRDMRDNSGPGPLYKTLENLLDYLSERDGDNYCMWHAEQKYHNYWSDQSGIFKPFSPLFALSAAIITDDENYYRTRALPMVEFALSRSTNMFAPYDVYNSGMVSTLVAPLGAPYVDAGQLMSLSGMFQNRTYVFPFYAAKKPPGKSPMLNALAKYRMTGSKVDLAEVEKHANASRGTYMDLLEAYEETGSERILKAAMDKAYRYLPTLNLFPAVPDEMITMDRGNVAPIHGHAWQRHEDWGFARPQALPASEQTVPAWRASLIGTELSAYRGGYWLNNHGQLMRLATYAKDDFMRDLQRSAMVGRFGNHAGDFRSNRHSLVAELPDAPMHYIHETNYSTFNPGHACEWLGAVIDFMISDLYNRSDRAIDFPSRSMYESGFRTKVYGDRPGQFYDEKNVHLWLPRHLLASDNKQFDYIGGHGNGKFYAAFWNQSFKSEKATITLNPALVDCGGRHRARIWVNNEDKGTVAITGNTFSIEAPPKGIVAYAIEGAKLTLGLQAKLFSEEALTLGKNSLVTADAPFGKVTAMLLSPGKGLTTAFIYTDAPAAEVISAKLRYRQGDGAWSEKTDAIYPYEFSTDIDEQKGPLQCVLEIETAEMKTQRIDVITLKF